MGFGMQQRPGFGFANRLRQDAKFKMDKIFTPPRDAPGPFRGDSSIGINGTFKLNRRVELNAGVGFLKGTSVNTGLTFRF